MNWEQNQSDSGIDTLLKNFTQLTTAIITCIEVKLQVPTLILLYSSLDIMGYLNMPKERSHNTPQDFYIWVEKYYLPNIGNEKCHAIDLYSARCGLLHSMSYESNLTRDKVAKGIMYAWGNASANVLERVVEEMQKDLIVLHINDMEKALRIGLENFLKDISSDEEKLKLITIRAGKMFTNIQLPGQ
jgi:hypothetical protein